MPVTERQVSSAFQNPKNPPYVIPFGPDDDARGPQTAKQAEDWAAIFKARNRPKKPRYDLGIGKSKPVLKTSTVKSSAATANPKTTGLGDDTPSKLGLVATTSSAGSPTTSTTPSKLGIPANISTPTSAGSNNSKKRSLGSIDLTSGQPNSPCTKWDIIIGRVTNATSKSKWHPKSVPTLRGPKKQCKEGTVFTASFLMNECDRLSELARKVVLGSIKRPFPNHNEAVCVCCILMEHTHTKFRSSLCHAGLIVVCAEIRRT